MSGLVSLAWACALVMVISAMGGDPAAGAATRETVTIAAISDAFDPDLLDLFSREIGFGVAIDGFATAEEVTAALRSGGQAYDLALVPISSLPGLVKANLLLPLDPAPASATFEPQLKAAVAASAGAVFAVPFDWYPTGLAVNLAKLKQAGVILETASGWDMLGKPEILRAAVSCGFGVPDRPRELYALALAATGGRDRNASLLERRRGFSVLTQLRLAAKKASDAELADDLAEGGTCAAILPAPAAFMAAERARMAATGTTLAYWLPAGGTLAIDVLVTPAAGHNRQGGLAVLRLLLQPEHAAQNARYGHVGSALRGDTPAASYGFIDPLALPSLIAPGEPGEELARAIEAEWRRGASR